MSQGDLSALPEPPFVPGKHLLGNVLDLRSRYVDFFIDSAAEHGDVFRIRTPGDQVTIVCGGGRDIVRAEVAHGLHRDGIFDAFTSEIGLEVFSVQGAAHEGLRTLLRLAYSRQVTAQFAPMMGQRVMARARAWNPGSTQLLYDEAARLSLECTMCALTPVDLTDRTEDAVRWSSDLMAVISRQRPASIFLMPRYRAAKRRIQRALDASIARHQAGEFAERSRMSMIDALLSVTDADGNHLSAHSVRAGCMYALCGSGTYLTPLVSFTLYQVLRNPSLKERVLAEVDAAFPDGVIDPTQLRRMPYLRASYLEVLRMYLIIPGLPYRPAADIEIGGFRVPAGEKVLFTPVTRHFDPETYVNPHAFEPARCMAPRREHTKPGAFEPFGVAPRGCLAAGLTEVTVLTIVTELLRSVELDLVRPTYAVPLTLRPLVGAADGLPIRVGARRPDRVEGVSGALSMKSDLASVMQDDEWEPGDMPQGEPLSLEAGSVIYSVGTPAAAFFILLEGDVLATDGAGDARSYVDGDVFGQEGLLMGAPRTVTATAVTDVQLLSLDRKTFTELVASSDLLDEELGRLIEERFIKSVLAEAMPRLDRDGASGATADFELVAHESGSNVVTQGGPADYFYIVVAGEAEVILHASTGERVINRLVAGDAFGEIALLNDQPRMATVRADGPLQVMRLPRDRFTAIVEASGEAREDLALLMSRRLMQAVHHLG